MSGHSDFSSVVYFNGRFTVGSKCTLTKDTGVLFVIKVMTCARLIQFEVHITEAPKHLGTVEGTYVVFVRDRTVLEDSYSDLQLTPAV
jgi:acyl CoA:acetate/3-ketoacid CoA transferase